MNIKKKLLIVLVLLVAAGGYYYVSLPAFNIHSSDTWIFAIVILAVVVIIYATRKKLNMRDIKQDKTMKFFGMLVLGVGIVSMT